MLFLDSGHEEFVEIFSSQVENRFLLDSGVLFFVLVWFGFGLLENSVKCVILECKN